MKGSPQGPGRGAGFRIQMTPTGSVADWPLGQFDGLNTCAGIVHAVTTRGGPRFPAEVATPTGAATATAAADQVRAALGLRAIAWSQQVHGGRILEVAAGGLAGNADGLVTSTPGIGLLGRSADCPIVLVTGLATKAGAITGDRLVGMAHASWRATLQCLTGRLVRHLQERWQAAPRSLTAAICPSAGPCCYEVGEEVYVDAKSALGPTARDFFHRRDGQLFFDLWAANADQLRAAGVGSDRIHTAGLCTICHAQLFPSYRREGEAAARFAAIIGILAGT